ncbi:MAG: proline dehydrogenase family protein [Rhodoferax sp.]
MNLQVLWDRMFSFDEIDEQVVMSTLLKEAVLDPQQLKTTQELAAKLAQGTRKARLDAGGVDLLTQEFTLDSREGVALMCLAEAMLRIPDTETRNKLIRDKIVDQDWRSHIGQSPSLFVNAAAWGLALTGKVLKQPDGNALAAALTNVLRRGGEGIVRAGVSFAMRLLGKQFVTGQTIEEAISLAKGREKLGYRYSYDMLGEGALTPEDAEAYYQAYAHTIEQVGRAAGGQGTIEGPGVSVKLTGLHPRYEVAQLDRVLAEMYPKLLELARAAKRWDIGFHLDQEEAARFPLTLEMLRRLAHEPDLAGWEGLGISLQSYQKRGRAVADWLIALGRATKRRILVRLVKGAYWDTEIKRCQSEGTNGYPVFTRKVHSDVSYLACAKVLLNAPDAIFPQFATHNAFSVAAVHTLGQGKAYEFQCLHGMGEPVYDQVVGEHQLGRASRVYAPVGPHATLLAYLVRRLLENGANTSFVNQVVDTSITIEQMVEDPVAKAMRTGGRAHPAIVNPRALMPWRDSAKVAGLTGQTAGAGIGDGAAVAEMTPVSALISVQSSFAAWGTRTLVERAGVLRAVADRLESGVPALEAALLSGNGITMAEAGEELRNAADLCRFYAAQAQADIVLAHSQPVGPVVILAPASSPLAWPAGQVAAALVVGNGVVLKPTSSVSQVALALVQLFREMGVPVGALQVVTGAGDALGAELIANPATAAVVVGGTRSAVLEVTRQVALQPHKPVLLARASGCNVMVVDSSALPEAVITDVVTGAFDGAGRSASALKVLCLQEDVADKVLEMLRAMLNERHIGSPLKVSSDIGPLSDRAQCQNFERHLNRLAQQSAAVTRGGRMQMDAQGAYVQPAIVDLGSYECLRGLDVDVVGPVLHVVRWPAAKLHDMLQLVQTQIGPVMLGLHTRIFETAGEVLSSLKSGGICVNRAVHVSRPGMQVLGRSPVDLGPSPTGPFYLRELVRGAKGHMVRDRGPFAQGAGPVGQAFMEYPGYVGGRLRDRKVSNEQNHSLRLSLLNKLAALSPAGIRTDEAKQRIAQLHQQVLSLSPAALPALSGEENTLVFVPRGTVLCAGPSAKATFTQVLYAVVHGNGVMVPRSTANEEFLAQLGAAWCQLVDLYSVPSQSDALPDLIMTESSATGAQLQQRFNGDRQPIEMLTPDADGDYAWWRLVAEQQVTINVSASGGNTQLMATGEEL